MTVSPRGSSRVPDRPQRMPTKEMSVTTASSSPRVRVRLWVTKRPTSSAMRWSGLSVSPPREARA